MRPGPGADGTTRSSSGCGGMGVSLGRRGRRVTSSRVIRPRSR
ncbi:MAG: hypothetical protein AVDCRST_MAG41-3647 [uncultured Corynebacteriales bacterium]|uniref:Uncharacterized protein n=1 Tax=uncultured Mycobacteriales bacterium TaxID=581187 RepID=A0A6J4JLA7_9ACTN|nr:MAG: hypothetical protein AVDCRST_MAG41-3647 [uncultured Corynebacteriales bacterium]